MNLRAIGCCIGFRIGGVFFLALHCQAALAQATGSFFGKVVDSKTKQPIPYASIFLASTMMGSNSNDKGEYRIEKVPPGKYDMTVSSVGYNVRQISISVSDEPRELNIELNEDVRYLKEVTVKAKPLNVEKWIAVFKTYFIGQTPNAKECTIKNLDKLDFDYDEAARLLTVTSAAPVEVENLALGYKMYYLLQEFTVDYRNNRYIIGGIPRFEELQPRNEGERRRWQKARDYAYYGSLYHFMRSLKAHRLEEEKFEVYSLCNKTKVKLHPDSLLSGSAKSQIVSRCPLEVLYKGDWPTKISTLNLLDGRITVHNNGYYEDQLRLELGGFYGQHEKIASEFLPLEYEPTPKIKKK